MLFRQLYELESSTYGYLLAARTGGEAVLIDPVKEELPKYLQLIKELDLRLVFAIDTQVHTKAGSWSHREQTRRRGRLRTARA